MQPERPIEKLLLAFARKRREAAREPLELHPATRKLLQGEVARLHRQPGQQPAGFTWARLWPRLAFVAATLAVLGVGAFLLLPPESEPRSTLTFAKGGPAELQPAPESASRFAPVTPVATPIVQAKVDSDQMQREESAALAAAVPARIPVASSPPPEKFLDRLAKDKATLEHIEPMMANTRAASPQTAIPASPVPPATSQAVAAKARSENKASPPVVASVETEAGQRYGLKTESAQSDVLSRESAADTGAKLRAQAALPARSPATLGIPMESTRRQVVASDALATTSVPTLLVQDYRQSALANNRPTSKPATQGVLNSFRFEQSGDAIRIVDQDGSIYTGRVDVTVAPMATTHIALTDSKPVGAKQAKEASRSNPVVTTRPGGVQQQPMPFQVGGLNRTLNQPVTFVGNLQVAESGGPPGGSNLMSNAAGRLAAPTQNQLQQSRLIGRLRLADGTELEINAVPAPLR